MNWRWHVTQLTPEAALAHEKRVIGAGPEVGLGWTPYNYLVTHGAISQWACHTEAEFERELKRRNLAVTEWTGWENGIRSAFLKEV